MKRAPRNKASLDGERFSRLVVTGQADNGHDWVCICDCGNKTITNTRNLRSGNTTSCGCMRGAPRHGHAGVRSKTYSAWASMLSRCSNPRTHNFHRWGGRGISVCERWRVFDNFLADMGEAPVGKSIDRFPDRNGNYEPNNCRWATQHEQIANRDDTKLTEDLVQEIWGRREHGEQASSIARRLGVSRWCIGDVLNERTWIGSKAGLL